MKLVLFYEKPGCATNARQKKLLFNAGCTLIVQNLLQLNMGPEELLTYLQPRPVAEWFNPNAPAVKNGEIDPTHYDETMALTLLLENPILIHRPLISVNGHRMCGFDQGRIEALLEKPLGAVVDNNCSSPDEDCRES